MHNLILASSSRYRREQLARLGLPFSQQSPDVDETPALREPADTLVRRLGKAKALTVADTVSPTAALIIASDQVCDCDGDIMGKPGTVQTAVEQLARLSGRSVTFHTSIVLANTVNGRTDVDVDRTVVHFRDLTEVEIATYVAAEEPLDCAGSFKSEGLGVALFDRIESSDPNALIGLPLIRLCAMLRDHGMNPLSPA